MPVATVYTWIYNYAFTYSVVEYLLSISQDVDWVLVDMSAVTQQPLDWHKSANVSTDT